MITYDNLWRVMKEKGVSQYALIKRYGISPAQITRLKRNESVSTPPRPPALCPSGIGCGGLNPQASSGG